MIKIESYTDANGDLIEIKINDGSDVSRNNLFTKIAFHKNGLLHRIDGAAVEWNDGYNCWYYEGCYIDVNSQEEFERWLKLRLFW